MAVSKQVYTNTLKISILIFWGTIETLYKTPPAENLVVCLDERGSQAVKSYPGKQPTKLFPATDEVVERARQEIDYGRRGKADDVFGAMSPADGKGARCYVCWGHTGQLD